MTTQVKIDVTHVCQDTRQVEVHHQLPDGRTALLAVLTEPSTHTTHIWDGQSVFITETARDSHLVVPAAEGGAADDLPDDAVLAPLPVAGYRPQSLGAIEAVNANKLSEEVILRPLDELRDNPDIDQRWLALGRTHIEQGFMAINRAIFKPARVSLPEDLI